MPGLEDLYKEIILDHYRSPRNRGELAAPPAHRCEGFNPLCGDEVVLTFEVVDGTLSQLRVGGQGCSISQSSASMMSEAVQGRTVADVRELTALFTAMMSQHVASLDAEVGDGDPADGDSPADTAAHLAAADELLGDLVALRGVLKYPVRIKCATLSWNTLLEGLATLDGTP